MLKYFVGFWQCLLAQVLLVSIINITFQLFELRGYGYLKFMIFLTINYYIEILPHPDNHINPFAFETKLRK